MNILHRYHKFYSYIQIISDSKQILVFRAEPVQTCAYNQNEFMKELTQQLLIDIEQLKQQILFMQPSQHFFCSNQLHEDEQGNYICNNQQCIDNSPICTLCAFTTHKDHSLQPMKIILNRMKQDSEDFTQNLSALAQIDVLKQTLYETCNKISQQNVRKYIKSAIDHFIGLTLTKASFEQSTNFNKQAKNKSFQEEMIISIIKYQKKYSQYSGEEEKGKNQSNYTRLLKKIIEEMQQAVNLFQETVKKGEVENSTSEIFVVNDIGKKFRFSTKLKHANLQIGEDNIIKITDQYVNYNYMALCQPKLSFTKVQSITFSMVNLCSYVTLGICNFDKISKNYEFNSGESNHGTYQISYDGYSWADNNSSLNSNYTSWYYSQGDKVTIEFDPKTKKLKFYKNLSPQNGYQLAVQFEKKDKLYFCVSLNSSPEEVHIII